jgi:hypothetical protein
MAGFDDASQVSDVVFLPEQLNSVLRLCEKFLVLGLRQKFAAPAVFWPLFPCGGGSEDVPAAVLGVWHEPLAGGNAVRACRVPLFPGERGVFWVTRAKENMVYEVVRKMPASKDAKILRDEVIVLRNENKPAPELMRQGGGAGQDRWRGTGNDLPDQQLGVESAQRSRPVPLPLHKQKDGTPVNSLEVRHPNIPTSCCTSS